jgi:hypothetical protein
MSIVSIWLVEYIGAKPLPAYATEGPWPTFDPWIAKSFGTKEEAEAWMTRPNIVPYDFPWLAVEHGFQVEEE